MLGPPVQQKARRCCVAILLALSLTQARCGVDVVVPSGPEQVSVHLQADFKDDRVDVEPDGDRVFSDRVTTDHLIGLAEAVDLSIPSGAHRVRVIVNGRFRASAEFVAGSIAVVGVEYERAERTVDLALLVEHPWYD